VGAPPASPEIWAWGLRNPWRFSFDYETGDLYIGDVGQNAWEEIDFEPADSSGGVNYGWDDREGAHCYEPNTGCQTAGRVEPVLEFSHGSGACSVTGGYVYRGCLMPDYHGLYFYGDYCAGFVRSFEMAGGMATNEQDWTDLDTGELSSFGEDAQGELYIISIGGGTVYKVVPM
jgi:glucose/arabinose dehydrogenase